MEECIKKLQDMLNNDKLTKTILSKVKEDKVIDYEEIATLLNEYGFTEDRTDIEKYDIIKCIGEIVSYL